MELKIRKIGNGYGVLFPKQLMDEMRVTENSVLTVAKVDGVVKQGHLATYDPDADVGRMAAALGWGLVKHHAFLDGNKRIALAAMVTFLRLNGYRLTCSEVEETAMVLRAAASEMGEEEWMARVGRSVAAV